MPLIRLTLRAGKPRAHQDAIVEGIYQALRETFDVPEHDRFAVVHELPPEALHIDREYLGIVRSDDAVIVEITANDTRTVAQKTALYRAIVANLAADPGLAPADVTIVLIEVRRENWSFGNGEAPYA